MKRKLLWLVLAAGATIPAISSPAQMRLGPSPYLSFADSPWSGVSGFNYFHLENFEDTTLAPGWSASPGWIRLSPSPATDSVDGDDGLIDGSGSAGGSFYSGGMASLTITFDPGVLGALPTDVGLVWTDVGITSGSPFAQGNFSFEAFDAANLSLGLLSPTLLGDGLFSGSTAEDRFFGFTHAGGISRVVMTSANSTDWEVDHLQFGQRALGTPVPEPSSYGLVGLVLIAAAVWRRARL